MRFIRAGKILNVNNKIPKGLRSSVEKINELRKRARDYCDEERNVTYTYHLRDFGKRYNGAGFRGTGGPKTTWLQHAVQAYIKKHYPELQRTLLTDFFEINKGGNWFLL